MEGRRGPGVLLMVAGIVLVLVGAVGLVLGGGTPAAASASPTPGPAATPASTASTAAPGASITVPPVTQPPATPAPTPDKDALVRAFFARLQAAIRAGTQEALAGDLGDAVIDRYGAAACTTFLASRDPAPEEVFEVLAVLAPAPWDYVTDGLTTAVPDATTVEARVTGTDASGQVTTTERELHVQIVDGTVRWFTDCGQPLG